MFKRLLDHPGLMGRMKYFYGGAICVAIVLGGYMMFCGVARFAESVTTERIVRERKTESARLLTEAKQTLQSGTGLSRLGATGIEALAVQMAASARTHAVSIESFAPQGVEQSASVDFDKTNLGQWMTNKVHVRGRGQYDRVMDVLEDLCGTAVPLQLESFSLQSVGNGATGEVEFEITVTVYRRKSGVA